MPQMSCRTCQTVFKLTPAEEASYAKFGFKPIPECFTCMQMHKLSFRNGRTLYRRTCDATGKQILSIHAPEDPYSVYEREYWFGDNWDGMTYGRDIDWNRPFFDQLHELQLEVPRMALYNLNPDNSDYCNMCIGNKDSYCVFGGDYNDSVLYSILGMHNRSCVDVDYSNKNELCHDLFNSFDCYNCRSCVDSKNCSDCAYVSDCIGCRDCILCVNLQNKQYCIGNEQLAKEEYQKRKAELLDGTHGKHVEQLQKLRDMRSTRIVKFAHILSSENCSGDFIENSSNCTNAYFCSDSQDVTNAVFVADAKDTFLCSFFGHESELSYQCQSTVNSTRCTGCMAVQAHEAEYCDLTLQCKNVFGCVGLRQKQYCILNKQYAKEEYEQLQVRLIEHMKKTGEWGEFLPKKMSCHAYNESTAYEFYPIGKEEALAKGFRWREQKEEHVQVEKTVDANQLPDSIADIPDDILNWAVRCAKTGRPFRIIKQELDFYRNHNIPLPRLHPEERYMDGFGSYTNPLKLYDRTCMNCGKSIRTTYAPNRTEKVFCEECYLKEVY
jgi:hypothetical protein